MTSRYRTRPQVYFEEFRTLEQRRADAGDAIWAILAGSKIAVNTLGMSTGSTRTLAEIFPTVSHIGRFNLRTDIARDILADAENDLCTMGMAYTIALHEDFVKTCLWRLVPLGLIMDRQVRDAKTANVHEKMQTASGVTMDADSLELFHLTRQMRNCHIHAGGLADNALERRSRGLSASQRTIWESLTEEPYSVINRGSPVRVGVGGLIATLAISKRLCYEVNLCLQDAIPRPYWADMAAQEYFAIGAKKPTHATALRSLRGYTRTRYDALRLTDTELQAAIDRLK